MKTQPTKIFALFLIIGAFCFTACGEKSDTSSETTKAEKQIPEAPDEAIQFIIRETAKGNGALLWQAMPASYQKDVNSIVQLAGTKVDAEIYDKVFATVGRLATVMDKQKEFIFKTSLVGDQSAEEMSPNIRAAWPAVMDLFNTLTTSSVSTVAGLQSFEGQAFFSDTVSGLLSDMDALAKLQPEGQPLLADLSEVVVSYVEGTETEAILKMSVPDEEAETESFTKVEDRWVPSEMATEWTSQMAEARSKLEAIDPAQIAKQKPQILGVFAMVEGILAQIEAAESQEQFDQALQGAMMPIMMMMGQGMGGGAPGMPPPPPMTPPPSMPVPQKAP